MKHDFYARRAVVSRPPPCFLSPPPYLPPLSAPAFPACSYPPDRLSNCVRCTEDPSVVGSFGRLRSSTDRRSAVGERWNLVVLRFATHYHSCLLRRGRSPHSDAHFDPAKVGCLQASIDFHTSIGAAASSVAERVRQSQTDRGAFARWLFSFFVVWF